MSKRHQLAYTMLEYGVRNEAAFTVICGEVGCGKTTLVRHLLNELSDEFCVGLVSNTHPDIQDLLEWILMSFGVPYDGLTPVARYDAFQQFLINEYGKGKRTLLIVDEAQNLSTAALESLRMLSNINADKDQLLQVVLVGQPQLKEMLNRPDMRQFAQRVASDFYIPPLSTQEVARYIDHRVKIAGRQTPLFSIRAIAKIADATRGIPRSINVLCDMVLVYAFAAGQTEIKVSMVDDVLRDKAEFGLIALPGQTEAGSVE